jgi:DNA-directed RNA polymerase beta subunit
MLTPPCPPCVCAGKYVERVALPYVFKYLVSELAAMNIRCSLDVK